MPDWADLARAWMSLALKGRRDRPVADAVVEHLEDALHDRRRVGIGQERAQLDAGRRLLALRVRHVCVDESVAVVRPPTEPSAGSAVGEHRVAGARLQPAPLGLRQPTEETHEHLVALAIGVDATTELRHPQLDAVVGQCREDELELTPGERALRLGDDERGPASMRVGRIGEEARRLRSTSPRQLTGDVDVVVGRDDLPAGGSDEARGGVELPALRVLRRLLVVGARTDVGGARQDR